MLLQWLWINVPQPFEIHIIWVHFKHIYSLKCHWCFKHYPLNQAKKHPWLFRHGDGTLVIQTDLSVALTRVCLPPPLSMWRWTGLHASKCCGFLNQQQWIVSKIAIMSIKPTKQHKWYYHYYYSPPNAQSWYTFVCLSFLQYSCNLSH